MNKTASPLQNHTYIFVAPEGLGRLEAAEAGIAPRLDYRAVADFCKGRVVPLGSSPAAYGGPKVCRVAASLSHNLRFATNAMWPVESGDILYSTGETWGLPIGLLVKGRRGQHLTHVVYGHRIYSPFWLWLLRTLRPLMQVDGWICVNDQQVRRLRANMGGSVPLAKVSQAIDVDFFDPSKVTVTREDTVHPCGGRRDAGLYLVA